MRSAGFLRPTIALPALGYGSEYARGFARASLSENSEGLSIRFIQDRLLYVFFFFKKKGNNHLRECKSLTSLRKV